MKILNLHSHSEYSNLSCGFKDSTNKLDDLLNYAYDNDHAGIAITDHESVTAHLSAFEWYDHKLSNAATAEEKSKIESFKLILGNEIYIAREGLNQDNHKTGDKFYHFILLALDKTGQAQLRELSTRAWKRSYMKNVMRRFNYISDLKEIIGSNPGHIVATTACIANVAGHAFNTLPIEQATAEIDGYMKTLLDIFQEGNIYIELAPAMYKEQIAYNKFMVDRYKNEFPFVITNDVHYLTKNDYQTFNVFMKGGRRGDSVEQYYKYSHFMTIEQIRKNMEYLDQDFLTKAFQNALDIGERSSIYPLKNKIEIPVVPLALQDIPTHLISDINKYKYLNMFVNSEHKQDRVLASNVFISYLKKDIDTPERREKVFSRLNDEWQELWGISEAQGSRVSDYLLTMKWIIQQMWDAGTLVGPGRGSAVAFSTNYYLNITDVNPIDYPLYIPHWRFLSSSRPELPDIDIDSPGSDRDLVLDKLRTEFGKFGGEVVQVPTYMRETSKKALRSVGRGLNLPDETLDYITSLIPSERGIQLTLKQTYYGDEEHKPVKAFVEQMSENQELWEHAQKIEGLITQMGVHAGGLIFSNGPIHKYNSVMKTKTGVLVTAYDLHESEDTGLIKYDILSVDGLGKLKTAIYLLLQHNKITWQGSLEKTFKHYFSPNKLEPSDEVWTNISTGKVNSLFQLNTPVGQSALKLLHATSVEELGMINSLMRLQPQSSGDKQPLQVFSEFRENISEWHNELKRAGLNQDEMQTMRNHLEPLYGVADTQEAIMLISMDEKISGFSVKEANMLRKAIARKNPKTQEEIRQLFYTKGRELGNRNEILDYVWNVQVRYSLGYSFSLPHVAAYSYIALQEAILYTHYPSIYWNTACLIDDAGAFMEEDFPDLIERGYLTASEKYYEIEEADDLDEIKIETTSIDRDKVASSIAMFQETVNIAAPDINSSGFGFTLNEETNTIQTGFKVVSKLGNKFIYDIVRSRPYYSFREFLESTRIPKDRVVMLIKAGAFRKVSKKPTLELLKEYVLSVSNPKTVLNGRNINMLITRGLLPPELDFEQRVYNWWKYISPTQKVRTGYVKLDEPALRFFEENFDNGKIEHFNNGVFVSFSYAKGLVDSTNNKIKIFIKENHDKLLEQINESLFNDEWDKYQAVSEAEAEMQSLRMYTGKHPLDKFNLVYDKVSDMEENNFVGQFNIRGKIYPKYHIYRTVGTVVGKDKLKNMVTILTPQGAVKIKMWQDLYNIYDRKITTVENGMQKVIQGSFFEVGTHIVVFGQFRNDMIYPKVYKDSGSPREIYKLNITDIITMEEKLDEGSDN